MDSWTHWPIVDFHYPVQFLIDFPWSGIDKLLAVSSDLIKVSALVIAGFSMEELMSIPAGRRRKYHDDVTVMVIILGSNHRAMKASTWI